MFGDECFLVLNVTGRVCFLLLLTPRPSSTDPSPYTHLKNLVLILSMPQVDLRMTSLPRVFGPPVLFSGILTNRVREVSSGLQQITRVIVSLVSPSSCCTRRRDVSRVDKGLCHLTVERSLLLAKPPWRTMYYWPINVS